MTRYRVRHCRTCTCGLDDDELVVNRSAPFYGLVAELDAINEADRRRACAEALARRLAAAEEVRT